MHHFLNNTMKNTETKLPEKDDPLKDLPVFVLWILLILMYGLLISLLRFTAPQISYFIVMVLENENLSKEDQYSHAFNYAIALEIFVFLVTAMGQRGAAKWFIFISISTQLLSMHKWDGILMKQIWSDPQQLSEGLRLFSGSLIVSIMSGVGIHYISIQIKSMIEYLRAKYSQGKVNHELELNIAEQRWAEAELRSEKAEKMSDEYQQKMKEAQAEFTKAQHIIKEAEIRAEEADQRRLSAEAKLSRKKNVSPQIIAS